jgi:hypothetical protein
MNDIFRHQFTDIMIKVQSRDQAVNFLVSTFGLALSDNGSGWTALEDPETKQRIVITEEDFGSTWAISIATSHMDQTIQSLSKQGVQVKFHKELATGFQYALCENALGISILLYTR